MTPGPPLGPVREGVLRRGAVLAAVAATVSAVGMVIAAARGPSFVPGLIEIAFVSAVVLFAVVGALVAQRRPTNRIAWTMIWVGLVMGIGLFLYAYGILGVPPRPPLPLAMPALVVSQLTFLPAISGVLVLVLLFPTGRLPGARWRAVIAAIGVGVALNLVGIFFEPGIIDPASDVTNPFGVGPELAGAVGTIATVGNGLVVVCSLLVAASLVLRYRRAAPVEAAQLRWLAWAGGLAIPAFAVSSLQVGPVSDAAFTVGLALIGLVPIVVGIAITRFHLFDIDRLINRTLVYGALTAILAGVFTASITLSQRVFLALTGERSDAAVALTTLVVATAYAPLRKQLESVVDRWFKYEDRRFGAYRDELVRLLTLVEPTRAAGRLANEVARELGALGVTVLDADERPVAAAGIWPTDVALRIPVSATGPLRTLAVGPPRAGTAFDPAAVRLVADLASLVGVATAEVAHQGSPTIRTGAAPYGISEGGVGAQSDDPGEPGEAPAFDASPAS